MEGDLVDHLRAATQRSHRQLEDGLDLLGPPLARDRFTTLLQRFYGFHAAWEPSVRRRVELAALIAGRSRLAHLKADLEALGVSSSRIEALPLCPGAARLGDTLAQSLGSLYVMEGSTLGGKVISRALETAGWTPAGGLTYFDPYGPESGAMWRAFKRQLNAFDPPDRHALSNAAVETFELLHGWLMA